MANEAGSPGGTSLKRANQPAPKPKPRKPRPSSSPSRPNANPSIPNRPAPPPPVTPPQNRPGPLNSVTPTRPKPPNIKSYLAGDAVYQQALRGGKRTLRDFLSDLQRRQEETKVGFRQSREAMELDRERQLERMENEFASRGLIHSSIYADEQGDFQEDFARQLTALQQQRANMLKDLLAEGTNFRREHEMSLELARQEALARRASKYKI